MYKRLWQGSMLVLVMLCGTHSIQAVDCAHTVSLCDFLQAELNEVATLTAQMNSLQPCDPVGAALIASYIPDHQAQAAALSAYIACHGGNPSQYSAHVMPCVGSREVILQSDIQQHMQAVANYAYLRTVTNDSEINQLAAIGQFAATRHLNSLQVALAATSITPTSAMDGLQAQLALESSAVADLQSQRCRLVVLGDQVDAAQMSVLIAQHQQQIATLQNTITQMCGYAGFVVVAPTYTLATKDAIFCQERTTEAQFINTYAVVIATLTPGPLQTIAAHGQAISLASLAFAQAATTPTIVAAAPAPVAQAVAPTTTASALPAGD